MGVGTSVVSSTLKEVLTEDDVGKLNEWLLSRTRLTGAPQHSLVRKKDVLHQACELGAGHCARYIADVFPSAVNAPDRTGKSALQCALLEGEAHFSCAFMLLDSSAVFHRSAFETSGSSSILHDVCCECESPDHAKVVKMALGRAGRKLTKNLVNHNGDTPLHSLLSLNKLHDHIFSQMDDSQGAYTVFTEPTPLQKYFAVVRVSAELLLSKGCDPNRVNAQGQTALSLLLSHGLHFKGKFSLAAHPKIFTAYIRGVNWVMEVLLKYGANPNEPSPSGEFPLMLYAKAINRCYDFGAVGKNILNGLRLLCQSGANPSLVKDRSKKHGRTVFRLLLTAALSHCVRTNRLQPPGVDVIRFLRDAYYVLRAHGLRADSLVTGDLRLMLSLLCLGNLPLDPDFVCLFKELLKDILVTGGDPNLVPIPTSSPERRGFSVPSNLKNALLLQDGNENVDIMGIVHVFYCSLDQDRLNNLLRTMVSELETQNAGGQRSKVVTSELVELVRQPRCLMDLSRVAVHKSLNWNLAEHDDRLGLPPLLKNYLYDLE